MKILGCPAGPPPVVFEGGRLVSEGVCLSVKVGGEHTTVADGHALVDEADRLLVDELDSGIGAGLGG